MAWWWSGCPRASCGDEPVRPVPRATRLPPRRDGRGLLRVERLLRLERGNGAGRPARGGGGRRSTILRRRAGCDPAVRHRLLELEPERRRRPAQQRVRVTAEA